MKREIRGNYSFRRLKSPNISVISEGFARRNEHRTAPRPRRNQQLQEGTPSPPAPRGSANHPHRPLLPPSDARLRIYALRLAPPILENSALAPSVMKEINLLSSPRLSRGSSALVARIGSLDITPPSLPLAPVYSR